MDGAHGVGAGERRRRRALVQFDGQGVRARDAARGLAESRGQRRRGGRGWGKRGAVRGASGQVSSGAWSCAQGGQLPPRSGEAGGNTERRWPDEAAGHTGGEGPGRPDGVEAGDQTGFRGGLPWLELRFPAWTRLQGRAAGGRWADQGGLHPCGGRRPAKLLRHHPARASDAAGGGEDQRWPRAVVDRTLPRAGRSQGSGTVDAGEGHAARRCDQPAPGQTSICTRWTNGWPVSATAWCATPTTSWF